MAYVRRYRTRRSVRKPMSSKSRTKTSLASLAKTVKRLVSREKVQTMKASFRDHQTYDTVSSPYTAHHLSAYSRWSLLWPTTNASMHTIRDKAAIKTVLLDNLVTLDNTGLARELSTINFTYFVFRPKDARGVIDPTTLTLTDGVDYTVSLGKTYLNPQAFDILYCKRFTLTALDNSTPDTSQIQRRFTVKLNPKIIAKAVDDNWKDMTFDPDPSNNIYMVLFNDNSIVDGQYPRWEFTAMINVEQ